MPIDPLRISMPVAQNPEEQIESLQRALAVAHITAARRCLDIAMERSRVLNSFAITQICLGHSEAAKRFELNADQFKWMANAIRREFGIKEE